MPLPQSLRIMMSNEWTTASIHWAMSRIKGRILAHADELNALDGAIGDGDLGVTLCRAVERFNNTPTLGNDVGISLLQYAKLFSGTVGSTYGTLIATRSEEHTSELQSLRHLVC